MSVVQQQENNYYSENNHRYVFLDGRACQKLSDCYTALQEQLSFPGYFGHNLDALEEVINDLDWITESRISIIIRNSALLLQEDAVKRKSFLEILHASSCEKLSIIYVGQP